MRIFKEEQCFTQPWLLVLLTVSVIVPIVTVFQEYFKEDTKISTNSFLISIVAIVASVALIFFFKLKTRIDETGIHYQFFPFHLKLKSIKWNDIEMATVRKYDPIGEYGGWGVKGGFLWNKKKGRCMNVSGNLGIQLELKNGKKLLIGTQKKEEAINVLKTYKEKNND
ncbi:hypothetical protein [uncultured Polaribacter sp.]|uniref:hypothetical protein n=1 Tax=uncultured Polaribacter sp. TaxID=174711 RepID=UPI002617C5AE|nr:hypothetical protein [uncultured Polaribacter sp.]